MKFFTGILLAIATCLIILGVFGAVAQTSDQLPLSGKLTNAIPDDWPWTNIRTEPFIWILPPPPPTIRWHWDDIRRENRIVEDERKALTEFCKTNTDPNAGFILQTYWSREIPSSTNDVELGYRSDGMVVWRVPPEAKQ